MRAIAYTWEKEAGHRVMDYWSTVAVTWGLDRAYFVNPCECRGAIASWDKLFEKFPQAAIVVPCTEGGMSLDEYVEPEGDVIYVVGGDYSEEFSYKGEADYNITLETTLKPDVGTYSFLAMSVIAHHVYRQRIGA